jgi:phosphate transport system substrate-binding protein
MAASALTCSIAVNGIVPTYQTIRERTYPFTTEVHVVIRKGLDGASPAVRLRDWLLSEEGQTVVRESGYVPISAAIAPPAPSQK